MGSLLSHSASGARLAQSSIATRAECVVSVPPNFTTELETRLMLVTLQTSLAFFVAP